MDYINTAKKEIRLLMTQNNFNNKITSQKISFSDLAREEKQFIFLHNWQGHKIFSDLQNIARKYNCILSTK